MRYCYFMLLFLMPSCVQALEISISNKVVYDVTVARAEKELRQGLMYVQYMPKNQGMLFDLRGHPHSSMWMKNTYISLDLLFLNCDFYVVDIYENAKPLSLKKISTDKDFCYVLEINGGEVQQQHLLTGDRALGDIDIL